MFRDPVHVLRYRLPLTLVAASLLLAGAMPTASTTPHHQSAPVATALLRDPAPPLPAVEFALPLPMLDRLAPEATIVAVTPPSSPRWIPLLVAADGGDPLAACRLSLLLDDCRLASAVSRMIETQVSMAASSEVPLAQAASEIGELELSVEALQRSCADVPPALVERGWSYLLHAAIAGHAPSMLRFLTDPPLDAASPYETRTATAAYRENAALFLGDLLQRASPEALELAFRASQGVALALDQPIQVRDPAAVVRIGTALAMLGDDGGDTQAAIEQALSELSSRQAQQAHADGQRLVNRFLRPMPAALSQPAGWPGADECSAGWPGHVAGYTAYAD
jgi:hypothetical protein